MNKEELVKQYNEGVRKFYVYIRNEDLSNLLFEDCNFRHSKFVDCDLTNTKFINCILEECFFTRSNLTNTTFNNCSVSNSKFTDANLTNAWLISSNFTDSNFNNAELLNCRLSHFSMYGSYLVGAKNLNKLLAAKLFVPPETGSFKAYKKLAYGNIAQLLIPGSAKRSSATSRKCRASKAKVLKIWDEDGNLLNSGSSDYDPDFIYVVGKTVEVKDFDEDRWNECSTGIHFFLTKEEAINW